MEKIRVVALGGLCENGKNCYCIEVDDDIFVVDCGLKYPTANNPGIDFLIPNFDYLRKNADRVKAVIVTHGHDDQYGALPYLLNLINVPVYASGTTITMIRMDYGKKFRRFGTYHFISVVPSSTVVIAGHTFDFFSTTHSISNSFGFALHTSLGNIIFTGDYITDYDKVRNFSFDMPRLCQIAKENPTFMLMTESVACNKPGQASPNHRITPMVRELVEKMTGQLFVALYTQNFYNITEIINLAVQHNKKICLANKTLAEFKKSFNVYGDLVIPDANYIDVADINSIPANERIVILTNTGLKLFNDIKELCYGGLGGLRIGKADSFVMACPSVPETEIQHTDALDTVFGTGCNVLNITRRNIASMHAQEEDVKMMLTLLRPKYYMPVKGMYRQIYANCMLAYGMNIGLDYRHIFCYENGMVVKFDEDGTLVTDPEKVNVSDVVVDGSTVGEVKQNVLEERATMSGDGVILMGCLVSLKDKKLLSNPDIQMRGFIYLKDAGDIVNEISRNFTSSLEDMIKDSRGMSMSDIERKLSEKMKRFVKKKADKEPLIICQLRNADEAERSYAQREQARQNKQQSSPSRPTSFTLPTGRKPAGGND